MLSNAERVIVTTLRDALLLNPQEHITERERGEALGIIAHHIIVSLRAKGFMIVEVHSHHGKGRDGASPPARQRGQ